MEPVLSDTPRDQGNVLTEILWDHKFLSDVTRCQKTQVSDCTCFTVVGHIELCEEGHRCLERSKGHMILRPWCCAPPFLDSKETGYHKVLYCVFCFFSGMQRRNLQVKFFQLKHMLILIHRQFQFRHLWVQYLSGLYMFNSNLSRNWCVSFYIPSLGKGGH